MVVDSEIQLWLNNFFSNDLDITRSYMLIIFLKFVLWAYYDPLHKWSSIAVSYFTLIFQLLTGMLTMKTHSCWGWVLIFLYPMSDINVFCKRIDRKVF